MTIFEAAERGIPRIHLAYWLPDRYIKIYYTEQGSLYPWVEFYNGPGKPSKWLIWDFESYAEYQAYEGPIHELEHLGSGLKAPQ